MMRVTTGGTLRTYRGNLAKSTFNQFQAMNTVLTRRLFNTFADDPALATQSYRIHASYARNQTQQETSDSIIKKFEAGHSSLDALSSQYRVALNQAETAQNDPSGGALTALGRTLSSTADSMVKTLNAKYGDKFIFAGADGANVPFELKDGELYFRGEKVDYSAKDLEGQINPDTGAQYTDQEIEDWLKERDEVFKAMSDEATYVDIGLGLTLDENENVIPSTAFNSAISGIGLLGYGVDDQGQPNNMISIIAKLGAIYEQAGEDGSLPEGLDEEANKLFGKMQTSFTEFNTNWSELETRAELLKSNDTRLSDTGYTLYEQFEATDQVDLADALTTFAYAQYSYNAALRVGNSILSQSFLDYMK